jgi:hypothetical protein
VANYSLEVKPSGQKELDALDDALFARIDRKILALRENHPGALPFPLLLSPLALSTVELLGAHGLARPGRRCRENVREASQREEAFSAGIAAIGGKAQSPLEPTQPAFLHPGAGDTLQIEVSASRAVGLPGVRDRYDPRIKAFLAGKASPRAQSEKSHQQIAPAVSARTSAQITPAARTDHTAFPQRRFRGTRILEIPFEDNRGWKARAV